MNYKFIPHIFLIAVICGFFNGFSSITNPVDQPFFAPRIFISIIIILFIPVASFSILYSFIFNSKCLKKRSLSPTPGLWAAALFGIILTILVLFYAINERSRLVREHENGQFDWQELEAQKMKLENSIVNLFNIFLILFTVLTPIIDSRYLRWHKKKIGYRDFIITLGLSIAYYFSLYIWGRIILTVLTVILFLFGKW